MLYFDDERFHLAIPVPEAVDFAMGKTDLGYQEPNDALRKIIGLLAVDALESSEEWHRAGVLRNWLQQRWTELKN